MKLISKVKRFKVLIIVMTIMLIIELGIIILLSIDKKNEFSMANEFIVKLNTINTSQIDLIYDKFYTDSVEAHIEENKVTFFANIGNYKDIELFSISFKTDENVIGTVCNKDGDIVKIGVEFSEYKEVLELDIVNKLNKTRDGLLDNIIENLVFEEGPYLYEEDGKESFLKNNVAIDTEYLQLFYPQKWVNNLEIIEKNNEVEFYCKLNEKKNVKLFTVIFDADSEESCGRVDDMFIGIKVDESGEEKNWSEQEKEVYYTMKEDYSTIINGLILFNGLELD